jgi:tetraacyldisaccharide 4'-kinase
MAVIKQLSSARVLAFAGIGRPAKFYETLKRCGISVEIERSFADHHPYSLEELAGLRREAAKAGLTLVTTAKDAMRLPSDASDVVVLPVSLALDGVGLVEEIIAAIDRRRSAP